MKTPLSITAQDYPAFYEPYVSKVIAAYDYNPWPAFAVQAEEVPDWLESVPEEQQQYRYAEGKWSPKQVVGHLIDAERVFGVRSLHFARGEKQSLIGFDQQDYVDAGHFDERSWSDLLAEFRGVRQSHQAMFAGFAEATFEEVGEANGAKFRLAAMPYIMVGHVIHHVRILRERYALHG